MQWSYRGLTVWTYNYCLCIFLKHFLNTVSQKTVTLCHCPYLHQILTNFYDFLLMWTICNKVVIKYITTP